MNQSVDGCKVILAGDQMTAVSSLFTLIVTQETKLSPTTDSWRPVLILKNMRNIIKIFTFLCE